MVNWEMLLHKPDFYIVLEIKFFFEKIDDHLLNLHISKWLSISVVVGIYQSKVFLLGVVGLHAKFCCNIAHSNFIQLHQENVLVIFDFLLILFFFGFFVEFAEIFLPTATAEQFSDIRESD